MPSSDGGVLCVVQARTGSTRLPGKVLADLGGRPMLAFLLDRIAGLPVAEIVLATSTLERDDPVAELASAAGVAVVRGPEQDVLARFALALQDRAPRAVVRLTADCPLIDPQVVADVIALREARDADYATNVLPRTFPKGLDVEVMSAAALATAAAEATDPVEREHVTPFLYRRPERFRLANLRCPEPLGRERWTVDTPADLERVRGIVARTTAGSWREVLRVAGRSGAPAAGELALRPAEETDADFVLALRNDPDAVRFSGTGAAVAPADHARWYAARLDDPGTPLWIAEVDGAAVATTRLDVVSGVAEVSIAVAPEARGRGLAGRTLGLLQDVVRHGVQVTRLVAAVHPGNAASLRLFQAAGFSTDGSREGMQLLTWDNPGVEVSS